MRQKVLSIGAALALLIAQGKIAVADDSFGYLPAVKVIVYPGDTITAEMIVLKPAPQTFGLGAIVTEKQSLVGRIARRTLLPGRPIPKNAIREPYAVQQGKTVPLIFQSGTITISGVALALESGSAGEVVNARNPDSGIVIRAVIQADGSLRAQ